MTVVERHLGAAGIWLTYHFRRDIRDGKPLMSPKSPPPCGAQVLSQRVWALLPSPLVPSSSLVREGHPNPVWYPPPWGLPQHLSITHFMVEGGAHPSLHWRGNERQSETVTKWHFIFTYKPWPGSAQSSDPQGHLHASCHGASITPWGAEASGQVHPEVQCLSTSLKSKIAALDFTSIQSMRHTCTPLAAASSAVTPSFYWLCAARSEDLSSYRRAVKQELALETWW